MSKFRHCLDQLVQSKYSNLGFFVSQMSLRMQKDQNDAHVIPCNIAEKNPAISATKRFYHTRDQIR